MKQTQRIFQVYQEKGAHEEPIDITTTDDLKPGGSKQWAYGFINPGKWRWRLVSTRNGQVVAGSQEAFDSRANALRAARREASFYQPGTAAVEVV